MALTLHADIKKTNDIGMTLYHPTYEHGIFLYAYVYHKCIVFFMKLIPGESMECSQHVTMNGIFIIFYFSLFF